MRLSTLRKRTSGLLGLALVITIPTWTLASGRGSGGRRQSSAGTQGAETLLCKPAQSANATGTPTTATPATAASTTATTTTPATTATASPDARATGYVIGVQSDQTADGVMAAVLYYATAPTGRTPIAGFADVAKVSPADASVALELKSTDQSPFRFDLTIAAAQAGSPWRAATLITADLFSDGTLSSLSYECRVQRE